MLMLRVFATNDLLNRKNREPRLLNPALSCNAESAALPWKGTQVLVSSLLLSGCPHANEKALAVCPGGGSEGQDDKGSRVLAALGDVTEQSPEP